MRRKPSLRPGGKARGRERLRALWSRKPELATWFVGFILTWSLLVVARFDIIDSPPYYDFATGLFLEADFLAGSDFDYAKLFHEQNRWMEGGAAVYITSVMPTYVAVLMRSLPSARAVLVAYHLTTFAAAALLALLTFAALRPRTGTWGAAATAACLLTVPLLSTQVDMCGMDLPMAVLALAAVLLISRGFYGWSAVAAAGAFLIKTPGRAVVAATILYLLALIILGRRLATPDAQRRQWRGLGWHLLVLAAELAIIDWTNALPHSAIETWSQSRGYFRGENFWNWMPYWFPDQLVVFFACCVGLIAAAASVFRRQIRDSQRQPAMLAWRAAAYRVLIDEPIIVIGWTIIVGMLTALWFVYCLPRYFMLILPFLYLTVGRLLFSSPRWRRVGLAVVVGLTAFNLANVEGDFFPEIDHEPYNACRNGAMLERSREYLRDHRSNIEGIARLARLYPNATVVCSSPYVHFLSLPRLGYVDRPLQGYSLSRYNNDTFQSGLQLPIESPREVVFVRVRNSFTIAELPVPAAGDTTIWDDRATNPNSPLIIYRHQWPEDISDQELAARYEMIVRPSRSLVEQANLAAREGRFAEAKASYYQALEAVEGQPGSPLEIDIHFGLAYVNFQQRQWPDAIEHLQEVTRLDPQRAAAFDLLGRSLCELNRWGDAVAVFKTATQLDRDNLEAWKGLAHAELRCQQFMAASQAIDEAVRLRPDDPDLAFLQGSTRQKAGDLAGAIRAFERAISLRSDWAEANNELAWLIATTADDSLRDPIRAVQLAEAACAASFRQEASILDTLAAAYAAAGRFAEAVDVAREAIDRAREEQQDQLVAEIAARLNQYERRESYRSPPFSPLPSTQSTSKSQP